MYEPELAVVAADETVAVAVVAVKLGPLQEYVAPVAFVAVQLTVSGLPAHTFPLVVAAVISGCVFISMFVELVRSPITAEQKASLSAVTLYVY